MATRLLQFVVPEDRRAELDRAVAEREPVACWSAGLDGGLQLVSVLLPSEKVEGLLDGLNGELAADDRFRAVLLPVEATVPRPPEPPPSSSSDPETECSKNRISREELYEDVYDTSALTKPFVVMVVLSTIIACAGMLRDNVAVVIGAMIMAPLLGPNVALALATTLGDGKLARRALLSNAAGAGIALAIAILIGMFVTLNMEVGQLASRTDVKLLDVFVAVAAGVGGSIAFTTGVPASVVGVMVAVALLPPLAAVGMLVGAGELRLAYYALLLLLVNISAVNLGGVGTFLVQGIRPASWWEKERARRAVMRAGAAWIFMFLVLAIAISLSRD